MKVLNLSKVLMFLALVRTMDLIMPPRPSLAVVTLLFFLAVVLGGVAALRGELDG